LRHHRASEDFHSPIVTSDLALHIELARSWSRP
jgi:hypothetical protein